MDHERTRWPVWCQREFFDPADSLTTKTTIKWENKKPWSQRDACWRAPAPSACAQLTNEISICMFYYGRTRLLQRHGGGIPDPGWSLLSGSSPQLWVKDTLKRYRRALIQPLWLQNAIRSRLCLHVWLSRGLPQSHTSQSGQADSHNYFLISPS